MIKNITPQFTECGKIKLGELGAERQSKSGGTYRMPVKLDEFKVTTTYRDQSGQLVEDKAITEALKQYRDPDGKLRHIPILLHSDVLDEVFPTAYARYAGKKLHCRGDGETAERYEIVTNGGKTTRTGNRKNVPCTCQFVDDKSCKPHGILYCSIRVPGLAVAGAIHTFRTTSIISIQRIIGSLTQIQKATGVLQGLPLMLSVQPVLVTPDNKSTTVYCAHIELRAQDIVAAQRAALETAKMRMELAGEVVEMNGRYRAMLRAPGEDESDDEQAAVAAEFAPQAPGNVTVAQPARRIAAPKTKAPEPDPATVDDEPPHDPVTGEVHGPPPAEYDYGPPPMTDEQIERAEKALASAPNPEPEKPAQTKEQREAAAMAAIRAKKAASKQREPGED